ncbi:hypothetical protein EYC84_006806 [Monilinia fructicola]|uniref:ABC1 atypical kinase-like domain-containing protein n=1 Tax=Monilinia fructicola TaxID=38448 RepID=A0A5M9K4I6_MONFR|nr:hypothetical protein EYC84_006806 [Monilinia fructicola]
MMRLQLDLRIEAANLSIFRKNFKPRTTAWFPFPYTQFTTRQVLVEEFAQGIPLSDFMENGGGVFQQDIADEGLDAFLPNIETKIHSLNQMSLNKYWQDFSHTDTKKDPQAWQAELSKIDKEEGTFLIFLKLLLNLMAIKAGHLMCQRCRQPDAVIDEELYSLKMQHLVLGVKSRTLALGNMKIGDILNEVLSMVRTHHVRMEGILSMLFISILLLEGIGRSLNPGIDLLSSALPILRELGAQSGGGMLRQGDFSMLKVWAGLEARKFLQASIEDVERCVKYDLLSPNV